MIIDHTTRMSLPYARSANVGDLVMPSAGTTIWVITQRTGKPEDRLGYRLYGLALGPVFPATMEAYADQLVQLPAGFTLPAEESRHLQIIKGNPGASYDTLFELNRQAERGTL